MLNPDFWQSYHCADDARPAAPLAEPLDFAKVLSRLDAGDMDDEEDSTKAELAVGALAMHGNDDPEQSAEVAMPIPSPPKGNANSAVTPPRHKTTPLIPWK